MRPKDKTPVELHKINNLSVYVKRDDLMGDNKKLPPWGKMLSIKALIDKLDKNVPIVQLNVFGSWSGWALSSLANQEVHVVMPDTKKITEEYRSKIESNGGIIKLLRPNMMRILYAQAKNFAIEKGFQQLPYAFNDSIYLGLMAKRLYSTLQSDFEALGSKVDVLIVSSGSGVTLTALSKALHRHNPDGQVYSVSVSSVKTVSTVLDKWKVNSPNIKVLQSEYEFSDMMPNYSVPFPCNQFWDKKTWHWLDHNSKMFKNKTVLFWNLGGEYSFL